MAKSKKFLSALISLAMSASVLSAAVPASAARSVTDVLNADNDGLSVWVKAETGVNNGVWEDQSGKGNDLIAQGYNTNPEVVEDAINGHSAIKLRQYYGDNNEMYDNTFFTTQYDEMYTGDSTVFIVAQLNSHEDYLGLYSTGDGVTPRQPGSYENMIMNYGKLETYYRDASGNEASRDRACEATDDTIPEDAYMNYSYTIANDGTNVSQIYRYTDSWGDYRNGTVNHGTVEENAYMNHYGFVLGNRDNYQYDWGTPDMDVAEVIVVLDTMSDEDINLVRDYLDEKYFGSGYDPFAPVDYSVQELPDQNDPTTNEMPLEADDPRLALWVDGDSYDAETNTWVDMSASGNDMNVYGNITARTAEELNNSTVLHFPGTSGSTAAVKLPEIYDGSSMIYFVYKPYKVDDSEAPADYSLGYKGIFTSDYVPADGNPLLGRCSGIDVRHGADGVEIGIQSASSGLALNYTSPQSYNEVTQVLAWNAGQTNTESGSSYLGYTKGFIDFELETVVEENQTIMNFDVKDAEGSLPNSNTDADESARGLNRQSTVQWDTSGGAAKANMHYGYTIGSRWDNNGSGLLMDVAEMIVIHGTLTAQEKAEISEYLNQKYYSDGEIEVPEKFLAKDMTLNYTKADGQPATNGVSEAAAVVFKGTVTNQYRPDDTDASIVAALYSNGRLYDVEIARVTGISEAGASVETGSLNLPEDKSNLEIKIMGLADTATGNSNPVMDYVYADISVN